MPNLHVLSIEGKVLYDIILYPQTGVLDPYGTTSHKVFASIDSQRGKGKRLNKTNVSQEALTLDISLLYYSFILFLLNLWIDLSARSALVHI